MNHQLQYSPKGHATDDDDQDVAMSDNEEEEEEEEEKAETKPNKRIDKKKQQGRKAHEPLAAATATKGGMQEESDQEENDEEEMTEQQQQRPKRKRKHEADKNNTLEKKKSAKKPKVTRVIVDDPKYKGLQDAFAAKVGSTREQLILDAESCFVLDHAEATQYVDEIWQHHSLGFDQDDDDYDDDDALAEPIGPLSLPAGYHAHDFDEFVSYNNSNTLTVPSHYVVPSTPEFFAPRTQPPATPFSSPTLADKDQEEAEDNGEGEGDDVTEKEQGQEEGNVDDHKKRGKVIMRQGVLLSAVEELEMTDDAVAGIGEVVPRGRAMILPVNTRKVLFPLHPSNARPALPATATTGTSGR